MARTRRSRSRRGFVRTNILTSGAAVAGGLALAQLGVDRIPIDAIQTNEYGPAITKGVLGFLTHRFGRKAGVPSHVANGLAAGMIGGALIDVWQLISPGTAPATSGGVSGFNYDDAALNGWVDAAQTV